MSKPLKAKQKSSEQNPLGSWFRKLRQARGLPLRVIAPATDMNTAQLSKVELAKRLPTEKQKDVLTWYFGVPLEEMEVKSISNRFCTEKRDNPAASNDPSIIGKQRSTDTKGQHRNT